MKFLPKRMYNIKKKEYKKGRCKHIIKEIMEEKETRVFQKSG